MDGAAKANDAHHTMVLVDTGVIWRPVMVIGMNLTKNLKMLTPTSWVLKMRRKQMLKMRRKQMSKKRRKTNSLPVTFDQADY